MLAAQECQSFEELLQRLLELDRRVVLRELRLEPPHGRVVLHNDAEHLRANRQLLIASYLGEHTQGAVDGEPAPVTEREDHDG